MLDKKEWMMLWAYTQGRLDESSQMPDYEVDLLVRRASCYYEIARAKVKDERA